MGMNRLQCLFIGPKSKIYVDFLACLNELDLDIRVRQTGLNSKQISYSLKKCREACLVIISDEVNFSLGQLSDLVWRKSSDAIIVIVTNKTVTTSLKKPFNGVQIAKLFLEKESDESSLFLQYLVQYSQLKADFRRCKHLLGISEKRSIRMLESSQEPTAYLSRNMHLFANTAYLALFEIDSIESLLRTPIHELVKEDERELCKSFINQQLRQSKINSSLVLSMQKANGLGFRANIQAVPTVFKGKKCLQLWVHSLSTGFDENKQLIGSSEKIENTYDATQPKIIEKTIKEEKTKISSSSVLREILKRKEATILTQKLTVMKKNRSVEKYSDHLMLSLKVKSSKEKHINNLLSLPESEQILFWEKVKFIKLLQALYKKRGKKLNKKLYIKLSESSITSTVFMGWLFKALHTIGSPASALVLLIPYKFDKGKTKVSFKLLHQIKALGCDIAFDNFTISTNHLMALKRYKPDYICLSPDLVKSIKGNEGRELALGSLVRQFESKNIKVIAPCGLGRESKKLFALAGASFCQEKSV